MARLNPEPPCWVWFGDDWREGFVLEWRESWDDAPRRGYCEWTVEDPDYPGVHQHRGTVPVPYVVPRFSQDPRGRGGVKPDPPTCA